FGLRACIVNFRTEAADSDALLEQTVDIGAALHEQGAARHETATSGHH
ncbi:MAG: hypothetical protein HOQ19_00735, partial [Gemmatimonadaceae bacterium]|nr:hypothetical protein [Gemmatimonadaceae bacterium]